jgi:GAF domain-containing protein
MKTYRKVLIGGGVAAMLGLQPIVFGQSADPELTLERRVRQLEQSLSMLNSQVRSRTDVSGPEDRTTRDFNLETRLDNIERQVQQVNNSVMDLQRQISDAARAASQAQNDAMLAQQIARDVQSRIN